MAFTYGDAPQTPEGIARKRQIAQALMMQGMDSSPIQSPWQGVNRIAQALVGGYQNQQAEQAAAKMQQDEQAKAQAAQAAAAAKPDWQWHDGGLYNMNSSTPPIAVSQAIRQADDWKKLNERQMYRQGADGQPEFFDIPGNESGVAAVTAAQATKGAPQGMKWKDPANVNAGLEHIPGYTKPIPAEMAGKLSMMKVAKRGIADTKDALLRDWGSTDVLKNAAASTLPNWAGGDISTLSGDIGVAKRNVSIGVESALRVMTGAAAPETEVARYAQMFTPGITDSKESATQKLNALDDFMDIAEKVTMAGRGGDFNFEDIDAYLQSKQAERQAAEAAGSQSLGRAINHGAPKPAPAVGEVRADSSGGKWRFKGGDPADPNAWEPAQ